MIQNIIFFVCLIASAVFFFRAFYLAAKELPYEFDAVLCILFFTVVLALTAYNLVDIFFSDELNTITNTITAQR